MKNEKAKSSLDPSPSNTAEQLLKQTSGISKAFFNPEHNLRVKLKAT